jgi:osmoprotectant transport system ATP-binding protein
MITFNHVSKEYRGTHTLAVNDVSLTIQEGEIFVLLGSSGSGKTTLMKMINRLIDPTKGTVMLDDKPVKGYPITKLRRSIGYVFQQIGLFPHMTIEENITIVLKLMHKSKLMRKQRAHELLNLIHLDPDQYANRYPSELSGGQQQRVGVARALASNPNYLLMDEPFGALDAITRHSLQQEVLDLNQQLHKTIVFVTHDLNEAFMLADRIGIMHQGKLEQVGTPKEIHDNPKSEFVAELFAQHKTSLDKDETQ